MRYLLLPVLLTVLCLTGFTSQVQANENGVALMSLEQGGTTDVMGSREFIVPVCNEFEVELWVRDLPTAMKYMVVYVTWDPDLMELRNFKLNQPSGWIFFEGPTPPLENYNRTKILFSGEEFSLDWKWVTFTFHCKGEGSSPINIPEIYEDPFGGSVFIGPYESFPSASPIPNTKLKASVTQIDATVGGVTTPTNKLEIIAPYIVLTGLIAVVSIIYVIKKRKD